MTENWFALSVRIVTRSDGARFAVVTNLGSGSVFYNGYNPTTPATVVEQETQGHWDTQVLRWCEQGLSPLRQWEIAPGQTKMLCLFPSGRRKNLRCWLPFTNAPDQALPMVATLPVIGFSLVEPFVPVASLTAAPLTLERSLMLLDGPHQEATAFAPLFGYEREVSTDPNAIVAYPLYERASL